MRTEEKKRGLRWRIILITALVIKLVFVTGALAATAIGDIIQFSKWDWRVLDVQDGRALLITEDIIELCPYIDQQIEVTWETSKLREYLNGEFLQNFAADDSERIEETEIINPDNLWYGTSGGKNTTDKVFLLSIEEADKYFGDSEDYLNKRRKAWDKDNRIWFPVDDGFAFSNTNDSDRIAKYDNNSWVWWLRSPGISGRFAAVISSNGNVSVHGFPADTVSIIGNKINDSAGVRPALWLNLNK